MRARGLVATLAVAVCLPCGSAAADAGPALTVDASAGRHAISPYIYGWNFAPADIAAQIDLPVDRRGGNAADTLNWHTGVENHSNDYFFENLPQCWSSCPAGWNPARAYTDQIDADRAIHAQTLIDVPMLGYVPKPPAKFDHPFDCSYPAGSFAHDAVDPYDTNCSNGSVGGAFSTNTAQLGTAVADSPATEAAWVNDLKSRYQAAADGGVGFYELGNEPGLWNSTHHDWHPAPVTYDELWLKSQELASAIKGADPTAQVLGFSEWGWPNYFCSAADDTSDGCSAGDTDRVKHNGTPIVEWLLQQFKSWADKNAGERLIDYLDVHYYRQDTNHAAGLRATRSLWDPSYTDEGWIGDQIRLIPRMHEWVDQNYPGTKISLSEYDLAIDEGDNDAHVGEDNLIEADTLGIFAREGLDLATLWPETNTSHYADAFRFFRSYDGSRSKFGETYVSSQSADQSKLAVYGAQRTVDGALTLAVVNKSTSDLTSAVGLAGFAPGGPAQVWRWTGVAGGIARAADQAVDAGGFSATFPARSMTMVVIPLAGTPLAPGPGPASGAPPTGSGPGTTPGSLTGRCTVPRLIGLTLKKAKARLKRAHCRLGKVTSKKSSKRRGRVIAQKPRARTHLKPGGKVAVVLSRGR